MFSATEGLETSHSRLIDFFKQEKAFKIIIKKKNPS